MDTGLLRPGGVEVVFLHGPDDFPGTAGWQFLERLSVAGGLALVRHGEGEGIDPGEGWTIVRGGRHTTLLQAPHFQVDEDADHPLPEPRWVLGEPASPVSDWTTLLGAPENVHAIPHEGDRQGTVRLARGLVTGGRGTRNRLLLRCRPG